MIKFFYILIFLFPLITLGQGVHFDSDISARNRQLNHYHKMVSWDDSQYREFTYYETSQYGAIMDFMNWRAIFPPGYDANSGTKYPMIVMLHGAGESGRKWTGRYQYDSSDPRYDNNGHQLLHGGREHRDAVNRNPSHAQAFPGIVIFPQVSYNGVWTGDNITMASLIVEHMIEEFNADPFRIAVHGLSNGAKGVWEFATQRPDLFAAGAPMSGVGTDRDAMTDSLVTMPLWIFQGETDTNPSPSWSQQWNDELEQKGGKPRYTLYQGIGHGTWSFAYAEPDFFSWILDQDKREIFYFAESLYTPTPSNTLKLGFSAGFLEYQWTRNGVNIPGATDRFYTATQGGVYTVKFKQKINNQWAESFEINLGDSGPVAEVVHIPDANFKAALLANTAVNTNGDDEIQVTEAQATQDVNVNGQNIADLTGIEAFTNLNLLNVTNNDLTGLDLSSNTDLNEIFAGGNQLTSLVLPDSYVIRLELQNNSLSNLNVSQYGDLEFLNASGNQLTSLNLSANGTLASLDVSDNQLVSLNIKNGWNHEMYAFDATGNPDLECVQVDDAGDAEDSWSDNVDEGVRFSTDCSAAPEPVVTIPDANFKAALLAMTDVNTNEDDEIQVSEAEAVSTLDVSGHSIADLTGIEAFTSLFSLNVSNNNLTSADVSEVPNLSSLNADNNQLTEVEFNNLLVSLSINSNDMTSLDLTGTGVNELGISNNELTSLNLQTGTVLEYLYAVNNPGLSCIQVNNVTYYENGTYSGEVDEGVSFSTDCSNPGGDPGGDPVVFIPDANFKAALVADATINTNEDGEIQVSEAEAYTGRINLIGQNISDLTGIEAFTALTDLRVHYNNLTTMDLSANTQLTELHFQGNQVGSIDLSANTALVKIRAQNNTLTSLDLSANGSLRYLEAQNNALTALSIKNGNNHLMYTFRATGNPDLTCVEVDDVAQAETSWSNDVDPGVSFSLSCGGVGPVAPVVIIPDANFKAALLAMTDVNTNEDDEIQVSEAEAVSTLDVSGNSIADLTGIEAFTSLFSLNVSNNSLSSADVSEVPNLSSLNADNNQLTEIEFNEFLVSLSLNSNDMTSLDLTGTGVNELGISDNELTSLNLQTGTVLEYLYAVNNPGLSCIQVNNVTYYENGVYSGAVDEGVSFSTDCSNPGGGDPGGDPVVFIPDANFKAALVADATINTNEDTEIQVSEAEAYTGRINLIGQGISDLTGIEAFTALTDLRVHYNNLTYLDLSANTQLDELHIQGNQISSIDLSANTALVKLRAQNNNLTSLDLSANSSLRYLEVQNNALTALNVRNGNNTWMYNFEATGNPDLSCVEVDDVTQAEANWTDDVDSGVSFSLSCGGARFASAALAEDDTELTSSTETFTEPSVYPNPFRDQVSVTLPEGTPADQPLVIYDYLGRLVKTAGLTSGPGIVTLDLSDVRGGMYILRVGQHSVRLKKND